MKENVKTNLRQLNQSHTTKIVEDGDEFPLNIKNKRKPTPLMWHMVVPLNRTPAWSNCSLRRPHQPTRAVQLHSQSAESLLCFYGTWQKKSIQINLD